MQTQLRLIKFHDSLPKALKISPSAQSPSFPHVYHMQYVFPLVPEANIELIILF